MAKIFRCCDVGFDCELEVHVEAEEEILRMVA